MIYIFMHYDSNKRIIIFARSYIEAKETLFEFNPWADKVYNILEFKMYNINLRKFYEVLNIENEMEEYPRILSESELELLTKNKVILDAQFNTIHNTHVLTKKFGGENTNLLSTEEFVGQLKDRADSVSKTKKSIKQMLYIVGDIWVKEFRIKWLNFSYKVYGKSRYQCEKFIDNLIKNINVNFTTDDNIKLLIKDSKEISDNDISNYKTMIQYMKDNNIKKFPFSTYKEEELKVPLLF